MTIECFVLLLIMMNSQHEDLTGRDKDEHEFKNKEKIMKIFKEMLNKM